MTTKLHILRLNGEGCWLCTTRREVVGTDSHNQSLKDVVRTLSLNLDLRVVTYGRPGECKFIYIFESRFESGNLRQARRVEVFIYLWRYTNLNLFFCPPQSWADFEYFSLLWWHYPLLIMASIFICEFGPSCHSDTYSLWIGYIS